MTLQAIKYENGHLEILDQLLLPHISQYLKINNVSDAWAAIVSMQVRGAPAIAIVGCLSLAVELRALDEFAKKEDLLDYIVNKLEYIITSRPTAVNLGKESSKIIEFSKLNCSDDAVDSSSMKERIIQHIEELLTKDVSDNKSIGKFGAQEILERQGDKKKLRVLTHCNTGSLATSGYGTALGVIRRLHEIGCVEEVYCTETRPYMQGSRLTAYELVFEKIPSTLICDSMVAALFQNSKIHAVVVGADRVACNGDTANKIGTYQIAVLCKHHGVPFYVCAPLSSVDFQTDSGAQIVIEERSENEVLEISGKRIAAPGIKCWNPAFDITPAALITGIITEKGVFSPDELINQQEFNTRL